MHNLYQKQESNLFYHFKVTRPMMAVELLTMMKMNFPMGSFRDNLQLL